MKPAKISSPDASFDLLRNDVLIRWQRALRLAPPAGLGVARRAGFFAMLSWLPIAVWALLNYRLLEAAAGEPLLVPIALPMLAVVAQRIPVREVLSKRVGVLL